MSLWQGVKGAQIEIAAIQNPVQKLRRLLSISKIFAAEVLGTIALAPFAAKASSLYRKLPSLDSYDPNDTHPVYVARDVSYSTAAPRNTVDLYLPTEAAAARQRCRQGQGSKVPVVVFVHGGVWAAGDKWHYAPLAHCLARLGVLACVVSYSLYPDALVPEIVQEVSAAFDWAMEHVEQYGGDRQQVSIVGHSAGAQLCMMALLQRAQTLHESQCTSQSEHNTPQQQQALPQTPRQFVAVTGVYDIAKHYAYEKQRGVHELSTMKRAMGGFEGFAAMSPAVILGAALHRRRCTHNKQHADVHPHQPVESGITCLSHPGQDEAGHGGGRHLQQQQQQPPACDFYNSFQLSGESIAHRIAAESALQLQSEVGMRGMMHFALDAAEHLPPTVLVSSCSDTTVPWYESADMYYKLLHAGVPVKHLVYNKVGHGDFVVDWPTKFAGIGNIADDWGSGLGGTSNAAVQSPSTAANTATAASGQPGEMSRVNTIGLSERAQVLDGDEWGVGAAAGDNDSSNEWRVGAAAGDSDSSSGPGTGQSSGRLTQQQQLILQALPEYCRDLAIVVMGQQPVHFVQHRMRPAAGESMFMSGSAAAGFVSLTTTVLGPGSRSTDGPNDSSSSLVVAGEMLMSAAELN